jgi:hypothetical protein
MRGLLLLGCTTALIAAAPAYPQAATVTPAPAATTTTAASKVTPESIAALKRMSDFLGSLQTFELTANSTLDLVTVDGQTLQMDGVVRYKAKKPGIFIDLQTDLKTRQFFYDGTNFTIYAPKMGFYATMPAPPTNKEFLKAVYDKTGVKLPLEDLFRWNDGDDSDIKALTSGFSVGTATIDGAATEHWAFREADYDWEVWIEKGDKPVPRKLVIVDRTDPARPAYTARLNWTLNPALAASDFTFTPTAESKQIHLATLAEASK